jgi:hypothetical protein
MGIAVYPRLHEILRARHLSVAELERQMELRFGLRVDAKTLYRLTHTAPIQRADLKVAGAAAAVLGVSLSDLFDVQAVPVASDEQARSAEQAQRGADAPVSEATRWWKAFETESARRRGASPGG